MHCPKILEASGHLSIDFIDVGAGSAVRKVAMMCSNNLRGKWTLHISSSSSLFLWEYNNMQIFPAGRRDPSCYTSLHAKQTSPTGHTGCCTLKHLLVRKSPLQNRHSWDLKCCFIHHVLSLMHACVGRQGQHIHPPCSASSIWSPFLFF